MATKPPHIVVLGGGACGMTSALELARHGIQATVLEREQRVGGLCGTHERHGYRFDFGGHRFITGNREIDKLVRDLVGDDLLDRQRSSVVLNGGKRYRYPLELDDVLRQYGIVKGARAFASYLREAAKQRIRPEPDASFRDWVTHRFGPDLYGTFFGPYTGKLWGIPPETISSDWASQRISLPSLSDVAMRLFRVRRAPARTYARRYRYPRHGIGQIFNRCASELGRLGAVVNTGAEVLGIETRKQRIEAIRYRDARGEHEIACDGIVSTISLPALSGMLPYAHADTRRSAKRLRFRAIRLLNILLEGPQVSPHTWMYVSEPQFLMARIQEPIHRSPFMAPPGATSLMLEIPCDVGDKTWSAPEAAIYDRCIEDLGRLGFADIRSRTRDYFSTYVREGYPIYHRGYESDRARVLDHVREFAGLISCGRQGAFRYIFMDVAMEMGLAAARAFTAGRESRTIADFGSSKGLLETQALTA